MQTLRVKNKIQYKFTKRQIGKFQNSLAKVEQNHVGMNLLCVKAIKESFQSIIEDLTEQVQEYETFIAEEKEFFTATRDSAYIQDITLYCSNFRNTVYLQKITLSIYPPIHWTLNGIMKIMIKYCPFCGKKLFEAYQNIANFMKYTFNEVNPACTMCDNYIQKDGTFKCLGDYAKSFYYPYDCPGWENGEYEGRKNQWEIEQEQELEEGLQEYLEEHESEMYDKFTEEQADLGVE